VSSSLPLFCPQLNNSNRSTNDSQKKTGFEGSKKKKKKVSKVLFAIRPQNFQSSPRATRQPHWEPKSGNEPQTSHGTGVVAWQQVLHLPHSS
jgi:hypothetical protein